MYRNWVLLAILSFVVGIVPSALAVEAKDDVRAKIAKLEAKYFDPILSTHEVESLLGQLSHSEKRSEALEKLTEQGQGCQDRIVKFAAKSADLEARDACTQAVIALDCAYQDNVLEQGLGDLYRKNAKQLLPDYWQRFRKDPHDMRAVAMLISADPEVVCGELDKNCRLDVLRYLFLRLREIRSYPDMEHGKPAVSDPFVQKNIFRFSLDEATATVRDVFPEFRCRRIIGHMEWCRVDLVRGICRPDWQDACKEAKKRGQEWPDWLGDPEKYWHATLYNRLFHFRYESPHDIRMMRCSCYRQESAVVTSFKIYPAIGYFFYGTFNYPEYIVCPLPELIIPLEYEQAMAEGRSAVWLKPYMPSRYGWFKHPIDNQAAPKRAGEEQDFPSGVVPIAPRENPKRAQALPANAVSLAILPPRIKADASSQAREAAELACDRLGQELDLNGIAKVVNRTELDAVLKERAMTAGDSKTMLSYDAMARLEIDLDHKPPQSRLALIDLSAGTSLGDKGFGWPIVEADVPAMIELCRTALKDTLKDGKQRPLKVRLLGLGDEGTAPRMRPLGDRLYEAFQKSLSSSNRILVVQHLEAGSAKEESLLAALGLSRLPGGRQFSPQADVTIELRVAEHDAAGKSFQETPVEVGVRLWKGENSEGEWTNTSCTVQAFDAAIGRAWDSLSKSLGQITPGAITKSLDDMTTCRRQAEAELKTAMAVDPHLPKEKRFLQQIEHLDAALKIDPTLEPAAFLLVQTLRSLVLVRGVKPEADEYQLRLAEEAVRYIERFPGDWMHRAQVCYLGCQAIYFTPMRLLVDTQYRFVIKITPELRRMMVETKRLFEASLAEDLHGFCGWRADDFASKENGDMDFIRFPSQGAAFVMPMLYRGMMLSKIPPSERQAWLDVLTRQCDSQAAKLAKIKPRHPNDTLVKYAFIQVEAAELARLDDQIDWAKQQIDRCLKLRKKNPSAFYDGLGDTRRIILSVTCDPNLMEEFDKLSSPAWGSIDGHHLDIFGKGELPSMPKAIIEYDAPDSTGWPNIRALAEIGQRYYVLVTKPKLVFGYISLDAQGRPIGKLEKITNTVQSTTTRTWRPFTLLPTPEAKGKVEVLCAEACYDKICVGTRESGLMVYDPQKEKWKIYGAAEGLPSWSVESIWPIGDNLVFCVSGAGPNNMASHYTLDLAGGKVTFLRHTPVPPRLPQGFLSMWRNEKQWMGITKDSMWLDLLSPNAKQNKIAWPSFPEYWRAANDSLGVHAATILDGRHFFIGYTTLVEHDALGKNLHQWWVAPGEFQVKLDLYKTPLDMPVPQDPQITACGRLLIFRGSSDKGIVGYDPAADTWYGPLNAECGGAERFLGTSRGVWAETVQSHQLLYIHADDLMETAKQMERVYTTPEYLERRQRCFDAMPTQEKVGFLMAMHQYAAAEKMLAEYRKTTPLNEAGLVMEKAIKEIREKHKN